MATQNFSELLKAMKLFAVSIQSYLTEFYDAKVAVATAQDGVAADSMKIVREYMLRRGKCVQSFIAWNAYRIAGGTDDNGMYKVGGALENAHYFLLNMDDMADRDTLRHGGPTMELLYRELYPQFPTKLRDHFARSFSEIASSLMYSHVFEMLMQSPFPPEKILKAMKIVIEKMLHSPAVGWEIHLLQNFESIKDADEDRFIKGLTYVTAHYKFVGPSHIGLMLADAPQPYLDAFTVYGEAVGTAFQMYDDILGLFGDPTVTGKAAGNDVREGKKTLLIQHAYKKANDADKKFLEKVVGADLTPEDIAEVQRIVKKTGSYDYSIKKASELVEKGIAAIQSLKNDTNLEYMTNLEQLARFVIARDK